MNGRSASGRGWRVLVSVGRPWNSCRDVQAVSPQHTPAMRSLFVALTLVFLSASAVQAQVDDPLYPLGIGSVWEFEIETYNPSGNAFGTAYQTVRRERREVVRDTVLAGEAYRVVRVLTAPGDATEWTSSARCAVRVDRTLGTPVVEWISVAGACAPLEQGMALSNVEIGPFETVVAGDTVSFPTGVRNPTNALDHRGVWRFAEGIGPRAVGVSKGYMGYDYEGTVLTYARVGDLEVGHRYEPGWWHSLVRLDRGDRYQYQKTTYGVGRPRRETVEEWTVRGDSVVGGTPMVVVQQDEYAPSSAGPVRQSLCGVVKGPSVVTSVTLEGPECTEIYTSRIFWFSHLSNAVSAVGESFFGSRDQTGYRGTSFLDLFESTFELGYTKYESSRAPGTFGSMSLFLFELQYAEVGSRTYGRPVAEGDAAPMAVSSAIKAYPNPFGATLNLDLASPVPAMAEVEVLDAIGRRVRRFTAAVPGTHLLDLSNLSLGVYVVRAVLEDGTVLTHRVTKVR